MTAMASARSRYLRRMCGGAVHARRGEGSVEAADDARGAGGGGFPRDYQLATLWSGGEGPGGGAIGVGLGFAGGGGRGKEQR